VLGDAIRLEQVLHNLIGNAVKYRPFGGEILVRCARDGARARVAVQDSGIGIPQAALPHLFQRFYRAANVDAQHISGMGIGLYVVKEIVSLHGGTVGVTSREGHGSTFSVSLPLMEMRN
jgi:signal transduction histidine kinase